MMRMEEKIQDVQNWLKEANIDGWLFYDFQRSNPLACDFLHISPRTLLTRRFFYWIPKKGISIKLVHAVEPHVLDHLPGEKKIYLYWQSLESSLAEILKKATKVAMEYSPRCAIPYLSRVDGGTLDIVRGRGIEVVSSAPLLQHYLGIWNEEKYLTHLQAVNFLDQTVEKTFEWLSKKLKTGAKTSEWDVQEYMRQEFNEKGFVSDALPICAFGPNSANPHYCPEKNSSRILEKGDLVLLDLWCKKNSPEAVYGDITWVGVADTQPSLKQINIFEIVKKARDSAFEFIKRRFEQKKPIYGYEADGVCRKVIEEAGFGPFFTHRTGHNIDEQDHGYGTHLDGLETKDERMIAPSSCFSIEPGIYLSGEFGIRLEYDVFVSKTHQVKVTGKIQNTMRTLL